MMGMLNSLRRFFIPALSPAMFNIATIACAFVLVPLMPRLGLPPIVGDRDRDAGRRRSASAAAVAGAARARAFAIVRSSTSRIPALREVLRLMGPGTLGLAAVQINVFVNTYLATGQPQGAVSWLSYAFRLMYLPIGLFGVSIATAALPEIARHAADDDLRGACGETMSRALAHDADAERARDRRPDGAGARRSSRCCSSAGASPPTDTAATAAALICYAPGLLAYSAVKIVSPTFYSLRDSRTPVLVSVASVP